MSRVAQPTAPVAAEVVGTVPDGVSFTELVYAHYAWWRASRNGRAGDGQAGYRDALDRFQERHGRLVRTFWCSNIESGVALTERRRPFRLHSTLTFHRETDWATKKYPQVAAQLHRCDDLAIRARTVLTGVRQHICLNLIAASAAHLLSLVDSATAPDDEHLSEALAEETERIDRIKSYYDDAANGQAQIVYFSGMAAVAIAISLIAGVFLRFQDYELGVAALVAGAVGAVVSVIQRINARGFQVDYDVGLPYAFFLGGLRPLIGGALAIAVAFTFDSGMLALPIHAETARNQHLALVVVSFLAGFSERWAQDTLTTALPQGGDEQKQGERQDSEPGAG